jgi:hypothetical protein
VCIFVADKALAGLSLEAADFLRQKLVSNGSYGHYHQRICTTETETKHFTEGVVCLGTQSVFQVARYFIFYGGCFVCGAAVCTVLYDRLSILSKKRLLRINVFEEFEIVS